MLKNQKDVESNQKKMSKKLKNWKNGLNRAILGKCNKSDQSRRGKGDSIIRKNQKKMSKSLKNWKMG